MEAMPVKFRGKSAAVGQERISPEAIITKKTILLLHLSSSDSSGVPSSVQSFKEPPTSALTIQRAWHLKVARVQSCYEIASPLRRKVGATCIHKYYCRFQLEVVKAESYHPVPQPC